MLKIFTKVFKRKDQINIDNDLNNFLLKEYFYHNEILSDILRTSQEVDKKTKILASYIEMRKSLKH